jgi:hypothetical protein
MHFLLDFAVLEASHFEPGGDLLPFVASIAVSMKRAAGA